MSLAAKIAVLEKPGIIENRDENREIPGTKHESDNLVEDGEAMPYETDGCFTLDDTNFIEEDAETREDAYQTFLKSIFDSCDSSPLDNGTNANTHKSDKKTEESIIQEAKKPIPLKRTLINQPQNPKKEESSDLEDDVFSSDLEQLTIRELSKPVLLNRTVSSDSGRRIKRRHHSRTAADFIKVKTIRDTVQKLILSEESYVYNLHVLADVYISYLEQHAGTISLKKMSTVSSIVRNLRDAAEDFADTLTQMKKEADLVTSAFIKSASVFELYAQYIRHISEINSFLSEAEDVVKNKMKERQDVNSFGSYLMSPLHRLEYYFDVLESVKNLMEQIQHPTSAISLAITIIENAREKGSSLSAIDSITLCPIDFLYLGNFIIKDHLKLKQPQKMHSMTFLFEKAIIFSEKVPGKDNIFAYVNYLNLNQVVLDKNPKQPNTFCLLIYTSKKGKRESITYSLKAETREIKDNWVSEIETRLWNQLEEIKEFQKQSNMYHHGEDISAVSQAIRPKSVPIRGYSFSSK